MICDICGEDTVEEITITKFFEYKGESLTIDDYKLFQCSSCCEQFINESYYKTIEHQIRDLHRKVDGLYTSSEIKKIRESLNYTQDAFGKILGGGAKAFARYENGSVTQSKPMNNLLKIIHAYPTSISIIKNEEIESFGSIVCSDEKDSVVCGESFKYVVKQAKANYKVAL